MGYGTFMPWILLSGTWTTNMWQIFPLSKNESNVKTAKDPWGSWTRGVGSGSGTWGVLKHFPYIYGRERLETPPETLDATGNTVNHGHDFYLSFLLEYLS